MDLTAKLGIDRKHLLVRENKTITIFNLERGLSVYKELVFGYEFTSYDFHDNIVVIRNEGEINFYTSEAYHINTFYINSTGEISFLNSELILIVNKKEAYVYDWRKSEMINVYASFNPNYIYAVCLEGFIIPGMRTGEVIFRSFIPLTPLLFTVSTNPVANLAIKEDGTMFATADSEGIIIKVWDLSGNCLYSCKRGGTKADIISLCICENNLALTSNKHTVHVFKLKETKLGTILGFIGDYFRTIRSYIQLCSPPNSRVFLYDNKLMLISPDGNYLQKKVY